MKKKKKRSVAETMKYFINRDNMDITSEPNGLWYWEGDELKYVKFKKEKEEKKSCRLQGRR